MSGIPDDTRKRGRGHSENRPKSLRRKGKNRARTGAWVRGEALLEIDRRERGCQPYIPETPGPCHSHKLGNRRSSSARSTTLPTHPDSNRYRRAARVRSVRACRRRSDLTRRDEATPSTAAF